MSFQIPSAWGAARKPPLFRSAGRLALLAACVGLTIGHAAAEDAKPQAAIVDIVLPLSGPQARLGASLRRAAEAAVEGHNATTVGRPLSARFHDDKCNADGAAAVAATLLAADPPAAVAIGLPCSAAATGFRAALGAKPALVTIATGGAAPRAGAEARPAPHPLAFRIFPDWAAGAAMSAHLLRLPAEARVALLRDKTLNATTIMQQTFATLQRAAKTPVATAVISGGDKDFTALADRLAAAAVTHVAIAAYPAEAVLLVSELVRAMPSVRVIATDALAVMEFGGALGPAAANVEFLVPPRGEDTASASPATGPSQPHAAATRPELAVRAALDVWAAIVRHDATRPATAAADAMRSGRFQTLLGEIAFEANGTARLPHAGVYVWSGGRLVQRPPASAQPASVESPAPQRP